MLAKEKRGITMGMTKLRFKVLAAGLACSMGMTLVPAMQASAQANVGSVQDAVQGLRQALQIQTGSTGDVYEGLGSTTCPGGTFTGSENIYDFNQDLIPDYAAMALVDHLINEGDAQVIAAINDVRAAWTVPIAQLGGATGEQAIGAFNPFATPQQVLQSADAFAYYMVQDLSAAAVIGCNNDTLGAAITEMVNVHINPASNLAPVVGAANDLNGDGNTLLDNWNAAVAAISKNNKVFVLDDQPFLDTVELFIELATNEVVPPAPCPTCVASSNTDYQTGQTLCIGIDVPGAFDFIWSRNGNVLVNSTRVSGVECDTLQITNLQLGDAGTYRIDYDDGSKAAAFQEFVVTVTPPSGLPVAGGFGLALLASIAALGGAAALRRKQ